MARPKGSKNKKKKEVKIKAEDIQEEADRIQPMNEMEKKIKETLEYIAETGGITEEVVEVVEPVKVKDDPRLANKSLFRPDEAADYFGYGISTIYTWIQHGILKAERYEGTYRISRESILACRFRRIENGVIAG